MLKAVSASLYFLPLPRQQIHPILIQLRMISWGQSAMNQLLPFFVSETKPKRPIICQTRILHCILATPLWMVMMVHVIQRATNVSVRKGLPTWRPERRAKSATWKDTESQSTMTLILWVPLRSWLSQKLPQLHWPKILLVVRRSRSTWLCSETAIKSTILVIIYSPPSWW